MTTPAPDEGASGTEIPLDERIDPGFETLGIEGEDTAPIGADEWYDVNREGEAGDGFTDRSSTAPASTGATTVAEPVDTTQNRLIASLALLAGLLAIIAGVFWWRRRREKQLGKEIPKTVLASGVLGAIPNRQSDPQRPTAERDLDEGDPPENGEGPEAEEESSEAEDEGDSGTAVGPEIDTASEPPPMPTAKTDKSAREPARIDLDLDIPIATRSVMMFSIEFSLEVANRSGAAVRDVSIAAKLSCAQKGGSNAAPVAGGRPIATIDRIGPQQCRRVTGQVQLPLSEVAAIRQGTKPLFIPLLHITIEGDGVLASTRSFVLGTPSASSESRVHPLPLDGPPGSLPPMRAQALKQPVTGDPEPA